MADGQWYVLVDGTERGPLSSREVKELVQAGQMTPTSKIRTAQTADYVDAGRIRGLFPDPLPSNSPPDTAPTSAPPAAAETTDVAIAPAAQTGPEDLFENFHAPPKRKNDGAPNPDRKASLAPGANVVSLGSNPTRPPPLKEAAYLLDTPQWKHLWPLATLTLLMGWVIGGFLNFDRMYSPGDVLPVMILALGGVPLACAAMIYYLRPQRIPLGSAIMTSLFTGTIGIVLLLCLQWAASMSSHGMRFIHGRLAIIWGLLIAIGTAYDLTNSTSIIARWFGFVFGVGLCEETTKLLPLVMLILWQSDRKLSVHTFLFLGFVSGIGFGIGEALYGYAPWTGNYDYESNLIRWYSAVPSHAIYTTVCAAFLWKMADRLIYAESFWGRAGVVAMAAGAMAVVHGTYDTVCSLGIIPSLIMEMLSFVLLIKVVQWATVDATEPPYQTPSSWVPKLLHPRTMSLGLGAAAVLLGVGMTMTVSKETAMPKILSAQLPPAFQPYINGVNGIAANASIPAYVSARFTVSVAAEAIIGTFTNTTDLPLHHLVITCDNPRLHQHHAFTIGNLAAHAHALIDPDLGWGFEPDETVTISANGLPSYVLQLP